MKNTSIKTLKIVCYVLLALIPILVLFNAVQSYYILTTGSGEGVINWDSPRIALKVSLFFCQRVVLLAMVCLFFAFIVNILKHLKGGTLFCRANVVLLWVMVPVLPFYSFLNDNINIAFSPTEHGSVVITDNIIIYPLVVVILAILYKVAYDTAEEQKLTV